DTIARSRNGELESVSAWDEGGIMATRPSVPAHGMLAAGTPAPDFELHTTPDQKICLHEFLGRPVILAFYPADWSPVCGDQMALYNEILPEFQRFNAELLGIS